MGTWPDSRGSTRAEGATPENAEERGMGDLGPSLSRRVGIAPHSDFSNVPPNHGWVLAAQVGQHSQHSAVVGLALGQPELAEDALYVLLHGAPGDEERLRYGLVGTALGHEG